MPQKLEDIAHTVKKQVSECFLRSGGLTVDFWNAKYQKCKYFSVHLPFLNDSFKMDTYCLACRKVTENNSEFNLCKIGEINSIWI